MRRLLLLPVLLGVLVLAPPASAAVETGVVIAHRFSDTQIDMDEQTARLKAAWAQITVNWSYIEQQQGKLDDYGMAYYDQLIKAHTDRGTKVLITVVSTPAWASNNPDAHAASTPPKDPALYADLMGRLAGREGWKGKVDAYEIWYEPNNADWWYPAPNAAGYVALLKAAGAEIREADPAAKVVSGGLSGADVAFLAAAYDAGMTSADIDGIGVHAHQACQTNMPTTYYREDNGRIGRFAFTGYRELYQEAVEQGHAEEIWMTEFGISTLPDMCSEGTGANMGPAGVSEAQQATFLRHAYGCLAYDTFVGPALWHTLQDIGEPTPTSPRYSAHWMGLFRDDGTEKPAAQALLDLAEDGITANPDCGGKVDTISPSVSIAAAPTFTDSLRITVTATDAETPVGRMYLTYRKVSDAPETQKQIVGSGQGGHYELDWAGAKDLELNVPYVITGYAYDEAKNLGGASVTVTRVAPHSNPPGGQTQTPPPGGTPPGATPPPGGTPPPAGPPPGVIQVPGVAQLPTSASVNAKPKKGRRAVITGALTYRVPAGASLKGRGRLLVEYLDTKGRKSEWVQTSRFTILASVLRRGRLNRTTGELRAQFSKSAKLRGKARKWRAIFEFEGLEPWQDSRAMVQFKAKG